MMVVTSVPAACGEVRRTHRATVHGTFQAVGAAPQRVNGAGFKRDVILIFVRSYRTAIFTLVTVGYVFPLCLRLFRDL